MGIENHPVAFKNQCSHLAAVDAGPASLTPFGLMSGSEWAGHKLGRSWMRLDPGQNCTTAATAAAHDNQFLRIVGLENEASLVGDRQDL